MAPPKSPSYKLNPEKIRKATKALLKWKKLQSETQISESETDDFIYLTLTLTKTPPKTLTLTPHKIPLLHPLHSPTNLCLIIDGKTLTSETAQNILKSQNLTSITQVIKLKTLKSDYKSFDSKKRLHDSFDGFLVSKNVAPLLSKVLGKVFYKKKRKVPVPVELGDGSGGDWREEIDNAGKSSLLCLSGGTTCSVRVGKWGVTDGDEVFENVGKAVEGVLEIVPRGWRGVRCFHLKFQDSVALPVYERQSVVKK